MAPPSPGPHRSRHIPGRAVEPHGFTAVAPMRASTFAKASAGTRVAFLPGLTDVASAFAEASADKSGEGG